MKYFVNVLCMYIQTKWGRVIIMNRLKIDKNMKCLIQKYVMLWSRTINIVGRTNIECENIRVCFKQKISIQIGSKTSTIVNKKKQIEVLAVFKLVTKSLGKTL